MNKPGVFQSWSEAIDRIGRIILIVGTIYVFFWMIVPLITMLAK